MDYYILVLIGAEYKTQMGNRACGMRKQIKSVGVAVSYGFYGILVYRMKFLGYKVLGCCNAQVTKNPSSVPV